MARAPKEAGDVGAVPAGSRSAIRANSSSESVSALAEGSTPAAARSSSATSPSTPSRRSAFRIVFRRSANPASTTVQSRDSSTATAGLVQAHESHDHRLHLGTRPEDRGRHAAHERRPRPGRPRGRWGCRRRRRPDPPRAARRPPAGPSRRGGAPAARRAGCPARGAWRRCTGGSRRAPTRRLRGRPAIRDPSRRCGAPARRRAPRPIPPRPGSARGRPRRRAPRLPPRRARA